MYKSSIVFGTEHVQQISECRATARVTTGQRKSLDQIEQLRSEQGDDGTTYLFYDHISQVCPVPQA